MLGDAGTPALVLYAIVTAAYGQLMYGSEDPEDGIDPLELWEMLRKDFNVVTVPSVENKINAMRTAVETDAFYEEAEIFIAVVKGLVDGDVDDLITGALEDLSVAEITIAMFEISAVRDNVPAFQPAVLAVVEAEIREEAEDEKTDTPVQVLLEMHKREIQDCLRKLGADPAVIDNF